MTEADDYVRSTKRRRHHAPASEGELEAEPAKKVPLVSQGPRSAPPSRPPPTPDDAIRAARRGGQPVWRPIG